MEDCDIYGDQVYFFQLSSIINKIFDLKIKNINLNSYLSSEKAKPLGLIKLSVQTPKVFRIGNNSYP